MENTVIISLEKYEKILGVKCENKELKKELDGLKKLNGNLKKALLESHVDEWKLETHSLSEVTDLDDYGFGLTDKKKLLNLFSQDELVEFVKVKYEKLHKEEDEKEEG